MSLALAVTPVESHAIAESIDRRLGELHHDVHWENMSLSQKISLYELHRYGYRLLFVRDMPSGPLAVTAQEQSLATIDFEGTVEHNPVITLR